MKDYMEYLDGMESIDSSILDKVLSVMDQYDFSKFSDGDVREALKKEFLSFDDFASLLSPAASKFLEQMARKSMSLTRKHFGNSVSLFTPLYISNYCENLCTYCGFNSQNKIQRGKLTLAEVEQELKEISKTGLQDILIVTGESRKASGLDFIGEVVKLSSNYFSTVGIEIYPLNSEEYAYLNECGADFVSVYQETYNTNKYEQIHQKGPKRVFPYRFYSQERALIGGFRGVAFGALLGIDDFRRDAFATGIHAYLVQQKYPHAEISFSTPRLRPFLNGKKAPLNVHERELLQVILAFRLFMPFAGITSSTRERAGFRDNVIGLAATRASAGVKVGVGGHIEEKGDEQFEISDSRSVQQLHNALVGRGLQPVYTDYIRV